MAKTKRKVSSSQRDKIAIAQAKYLKSVGILSKQTKLHGGKFISRNVLKKVREYQSVANLGYTSYTAPRAIVKAAKERGFQTVGGNRIIGPKSATFRNRIRKGEMTGVRPVKGGMLEEVILPHTVFDMHSLIETLEGGIDSLKNPDEMFAIKYKGWESYQAFPNTDILLMHLNRYGAFKHVDSLKPEELQEEFQNFAIFRLHADEEYSLLRTVKQRAADKKQARLDAIARGEYVSVQRRKAGSAKKFRDRMLAKMNNKQYNEYMDKEMLRAREKREKLKKDPVKYAQELAAARLRAKQSRDRRKRGN